MFKLLLFDVCFQVWLFVGGIARRFILNIKLQILSCSLKLNKINGLRKVITTRSHCSNGQIFINSRYNGP